MVHKHIITVWAIFLGVAISSALSYFTDIGLAWVEMIPTDGVKLSAWIALMVLGYRTVFNVLGSFIAAYFAPHYPMLHALVLGLIGIIIRFFGVAVSAKLNSSPAFYSWGLFLLALPAALLGGELASMLRAHFHKN